MNKRRLFAMTLKETLQIWRDPRNLAIALLMPLMQMAILGYGVSLDIKRIPLCVQDQEQSQTSRELVQNFTASRWFSQVHNINTEHELRDAINKGACLGVLVIPVDFSRILTTTGKVSVQTIFDASDTNTTNIAIGYAQGVIALAAAGFKARWAQSHGTAPSTVGAVDLESRVWFNEGLESKNFIVPAVVAVILALVGAQLTSLTVAREWERGTMEQLISTPVTSLEVMFGKLIPYFVIGLADAAFCLLATIFWFDVPFRGSILTLVVTTALFTLVVLGIGYLVSVHIRSQLGASQVALLLTMLPTTILSGYTFAIDQMPAPAQAFSLIVYSRYYVSIVRAVFLKGSSLTDLAVPVLALAVYAAFIIWLSARAFRKKLD